MKYLALLFTIYVLALSAWPCCGSEADLPSGREDVCYTASDKHNDAHETPHACSPFFHSSTYHAFVASPAITNAPILIIAEQNSPYPEYEDASVTLFPGDIWQPPQWV